MNTEMIDYQTRRQGAAIPAAAVPAADARMVIMIREALRDRQAAMTAETTRQAIRPRSYAGAVFAVGAL